MRLKSIKLVGFKSFVDPTIASFPENLTAVVGPNGCGKSNIIDAVRWVMGESSAKHLRGQSMADVIFNGSNARKPVAQAAIELTFDNSDGTVTGAYGKFNEIAVKRQVTRDGQSVYFLNGSKCRRRDIADIFMGTGLGPRSYAIIEQGMISRLIEAKPEELRVYIEEAAGISKYKARRRETENRIRRTRDNLDRLTDLREELERQLERLSRQAAAAEKYRQYKEEERHQSARLKGLRWRGLDTQVRELDHVIGELQVALEAKIAEQRRMDAEIERLRTQHDEVQEQFNRAQQRYYALGAEVARLEQSIQHQRERRRQLFEELEQLQVSWREADQHQRTDGEQLAVLEQQLAELQPHLEEAAEQEEASAETLAVAEEAMHDWQIAWEAFSNRAGTARRQAEVEQSHIQHLEQSIERLQDRRQRFTEEQTSLDSGPLASAVRELEEQAAQLREQGEESELRAEALQEGISQLRRQNGERGRELDQARDRLQQLAGRRTSLEALQKAAMGDDGAVSDWLQRHQLDGEARLADRIEVAEGWEKAVETVLGDVLQAVTVAGLDAVADWLADLSHGRLILMQADAEANRATDVVRATDGVPPLCDQVRGPLPAGLLDGIVTAPDLPAALALRGGLVAGQSVVTPDGLWLGPDWLRVSRETDQEAGILERRRELETLATQLDAVDTQVDQLKAQLEDNREAVAAREEEREEVQRQASRLHRELGEIQAQVSAREVRLEQVVMRRERLAGELTETVGQLEQEQQQIDQARAVLEEALERMAQDTDEREVLLTRRDDCRARLEDARQQARQYRDQAHQLAMQEQGARTRAEALRQNLARLQSRVAALTERKTLLESQAGQDDDPARELQAQLEEKLEGQLQAEQGLAEARRSLEDVQTQMREREAGRGRFEQEAQQVRETINSRRMQWQELSTRRQTVAEQLAEAHFDLQTVVANLPEQADEAQWTEELERIGQRIARLGQINLAAIDEYRQQSERKNYLDQQNDDLQDALQTLEQAIQRIDRETRSRFKEYYERINQGLQRLFPRVFGGGHAYLEMTGDDLLDTGVAIMARPPGKRNSTIHLLSGGEKALTALSLVFSIFELNPAPFCLLDEVDAPLDDANVGRFCNLVSEMAERVQFIYITHNKVTMEMAHSLMGVTMHEAGVSRLVSVDVDEAAEMAAV